MIRSCYYILRHYILRRGLSCIKRASAWVATRLAPQFVTQFVTRRVAQRVARFMAQRVARFIAGFVTRFITRLIAGLVPIGLPIGILLVLLILQLIRPTPIINLQNLVFDQYNRWKPRQVSSDSVLYIDIDEASLARFGQFPWPRSLFAELSEVATQHGAAAVVFDILFAEPDRNSPSAILPIWRHLHDNYGRKEWVRLEQEITSQVINTDDRFAQTLAQTPSTIAILLNDIGTDLPTPKTGFVLHKQTDANTNPFANLPTSTAALYNFAPIQQAAQSMGYINTHIDRDGLIRRASLILRGKKQNRQANSPSRPASPARLYPSLALEALRIAQGANNIILKAAYTGDQAPHRAMQSGGFGLSHIKVGQFIIPIEADGTMRLYYAKSQAIDRLPAWHVLAKQADRAYLTERLNGRIAFIGTSAAGLKDLRATPLNPTVAGVELHVQTAQQIIEGVFLQRPFWLEIAELGGTAIAGLAIIALIAWVGLTSAAFILLLSIATLCGLSWHFYSAEFILLDPFVPSSTGIISFLTAGLLRYLRTENERQNVRNAFRQYLSPTLVEQIAMTAHKLSLGGEVKPITIMFADMRGFTSLAEQLKDAPHQLTYIMNRFLTDMSKIIQDENGTIDKYIGDCIMAFWNAPAEIKNHEYHACLAALRMQEQIKCLNQNLRDEPEIANLWKGELKISIGLNTGSCLVGNIGSAQRFNYSVMGDAVNVAARLESQTKTYHSATLVGEAVRDKVIEAVGATELAFMELDFVFLHGKAEAERIFALLGAQKMAQSAAFMHAQQEQKAMLAAYRAQNWQEAMQFIASLEKQMPQLAIYYRFYRDRIAHLQNNPPSEDWDGVLRSDDGLRNDGIVK